MLLPSILTQVCGGWGIDCAGVRKIRPRMANAVREAVCRIEPAVPLSSVRTMEAVMAESQSRPRFLALGLALFSSLALAVVAFGVHRVISYSF